MTIGERLPKRTYSSARVSAPTPLGAKGRSVLTPRVLFALLGVAITTTSGCHLSRRPHLPTMATSKWLLLQTCSYNKPTGFAVKTSQQHLAGVTSKQIAHCKLQSMLQLWLANRVSLLRFLVMCFPTIVLQKPGVYARGHYARDELKML